MFYSKACFVNWVVCLNCRLVVDWNTDVLFNLAIVDVPWMCAPFAPMEKIQLLHFPYMSVTQNPIKLLHSVIVNCLLFSLDEQKHLVVCHETCVPWGNLQPIKTQPKALINRWEKAYKKRKHKMKRPLCLTLAPNKTKKMKQRLKFAT